MDDRLRAWLRGRDTGASSSQIAAVMEPEVSWIGRGNHPLDPADLGRCIRLLDIMPEWKPRMNEMKAVSLEWDALIQHWDELEALYYEEAATGRARKCYDRMRELLKPIEDTRREAWIRVKAKAVAES